MNVKVIVLAVFLAAFMLNLLIGHDILSRGDMLFVFLVGSALFFWSLIGFLNGQADAGQVFLHLRDLGSAILIAWLCGFAVRRGFIPTERLIAAVIWGMFFVAAMKLALVLGSLLGIDPIQVVQSVFGEQSTVAAPIGFNLVRLEFSADILGAFALFAVLAPSVSGVKHGRPLVMLTCLVIGLGCGFLAFSRYVWLTYLVSILAAFIVERSWKTLIVIVVLTTGLCIAFYDVVSTIVETRFFAEGVEVSDQGRTEQIAALMSEVQQRPILGKGLGAHSNSVLRHDVNLYTYELQWLALLMQVGIVGCTGIFLLIAASARDLLMAKHPAKLWVLLLFLVWLMASWTNPYLTTSFAGATFGLFMALFYRMRFISAGATSNEVTWNTKLA